MNHAWIVGTLLCLALALQGGRPSSAPNPLEQFSFAVGRWTGAFKGYPSARMPTGFSSPGTMVVQWGPQHAWIDSESTTEVPGLGPYSARVVVRFDARAQAFDAFVVNTAGNAARYTGTLAGNKVVFVGDMGSMTQRVTYENMSRREMRFLVEESNDGGATYHPHSEVLWQRTGK